MQALKTVMDYLAEMSFRLDLEKDASPFKKKAYTRALESLTAAGTLDGYAELAGVGPSIRSDIEEIISRGTCKKLEEMRRSGPPASVMELLKIRNIGPKKAMQLFESGISSMHDLQDAINSHRVIDPKLIASFYATITTHERIRRDHVDNATRHVIELISQHKLVLHVERTGSFRRHRPDVRDIDILICISDLDKANAVVGSLVKALKSKATAEGKRKAYVNFMVAGEERMLDLNFCTEQEYGCALLHFTGSKDFNVACRNIALKRGFTLNQYSLDNNSTGKSKQFASERDVLSFLGIEWVPPECRDYYLPGKSAVLPPVIEMTELVGDLHVHTKDSDGSMTVVEVMRSATALGYACIGVSDHSQGSGNGMQEDVAVARAEKIKAKRKFGSVFAFAGVELDVRSNNALDYDVAKLAAFDYVILALHAQPELRTYDRLVSAVKAIRAVHPRMPLMWAHPTGRLIGSRPEADLDWGVALKFCAANRVAVEINGQPARLDLPDSKIVVGKRLGCKFVVNSDSHGKKLNSLDSAVMIARRALLTRSDVINSSASSVKQWLKGGY